MAHYAFLKATLKSTDWVTIFSIGSSNHFWILITCIDIKLLLEITDAFMWCLHLLPISAAFVETHVFSFRDFWGIFVFCFLFYIQNMYDSSITVPEIKW